MRKKISHFKENGNETKDQINKRNDQSSINNSETNKSFSGIKSKTEVNEGFENRVINSIKEGFKEVVKSIDNGFDKLSNTINQGLNQGFNNLSVNLSKSINQGFQSFEEKFVEKIDNGFANLGKKFDERFMRGSVFNFENDKIDSIKSQSKKNEELEINDDNFAGQEGRDKGNDKNSIVNYKSRENKTSSNNTEKSNSNSLKEYQQKYEKFIQINNYPIKKITKIEKIQKDDVGKDSINYQGDLEEDEKRNDKIRNFRARK